MITKTNPLNFAQQNTQEKVFLYFSMKKKRYVHIATLSDVVFQSTENEQEFNSKVLIRKEPKEKHWRVN